MKKKRILWLIFLILIVLSGCSNGTDCSEPITLFEYNNAYYEYWDVDYLKKIGIYQKVTVDDLGNEIFVLPTGVIGHDEGYDNCKVYEYKPVNCNALVVVDKNPEYQIFGFCNFIDDKPTDGKRILEVYNITSADDIISIKEISPLEKNIFGITTPKILKVHKDREFIERFYTEFASITDVGNETYCNDLYANATEEQWQDIYEESIKGMRNFYLSFKNGLKIELSFYPETGYMKGYLAYYKLSDEFSDFFIK